MRVVDLRIFGPLFITFLYERSAFQAHKISGAAFYYINRYRYYSVSSGIIIHLL